MLRTSFIFVLLVLTKFVIAEDEVKVYKMCVPQKFYENCLDFLQKPTKYGTKMECIAGRDRIDCLELIEQDKADVMTIEPEDVYIASQMNDDIFRVIGELRFDKQKNDEFDDEDEVLIKKTSEINSLDNLKGLKSCHPGFNTYYGFKIPVVKLKKHGVLNVSSDPTIPALERELKAFSELFEQSCIVGPYSDDADTDQEWKKKYPNLCQLCDNPIECNDNDKYASFDGAISCLVNGDGDIAFTKRSEIRTFFGLYDEESEQSANIDDFEYLCEDGSRKPINGTGCSWAKRPFRSYITNVNSVHDEYLKERLQTHLGKFFQNGMDHGNVQASTNLLIEEGMVLHIKDTEVTPKQYITGYENWVERDESYTYKARLCVTTAIGLEKCTILAKVALSSEIRPEIECYLPEEDNCVADVANDKADVVIIPGYNWTRVEKEFSNLKRLIYENLNYEEVYIAIFDASLSVKNITNLPIKFDNSERRSRNAACLLHLINGNVDCENLNGVTEDKNHIKIIKAKDRHNYGGYKVLACLDKTSSHIGGYYYCNMEVYLQNAIYVNGNKSEIEINSFKDAFTQIGHMFGNAGIYNDVFDLFSKFKDQDDVIFNSYTLSLNGIDLVTEFPEEHYDLFIKSQAN